VTPDSRGSLVCNTDPAVYVHTCNVTENSIDNEK